MNPRSLNLEPNAVPSSYPAQLEVKRESGHPTLADSDMMTFPRQERLELMLWVSLSRSPADLDSFSLSEPARSTRFNVPVYHEKKTQSSRSFHYGTTTPKKARSSFVYGFGNFIMELSSLASMMQCSH